MAKFVQNVQKESYYNMIFSDLKNGDIFISSNSGGKDNPVMKVGYDSYVDFRDGNIYSSASLGDLSNRPVRLVEGIVSLSN